jgi:hypothetical protein
MPEIRYLRAADIVGWNAEPNGDILLRRADGSLQIVDRLAVRLLARMAEAGPRRDLAGVPVLAAVAERIALALTGIDDRPDPAAADPTRALAHVVADLDAKVAAVEARTGGGLP